MNQNEEYTSKRDEKNRLVIMRNNFKEKGSETDSLIKYQTQRRDNLRIRIEDMKLNLKKFSYDKYRFLGKDHYPFVTREEKAMLFRALDEAADWANKDYFKGQKKISEACRKLEYLNNEIKVMREDLKTIDSYITKINSRIRKLSE